MGALSIYSAIILAGGKSSRFGEEKKDFKIHGRSMIDYVIQSASEVCKNIIVVIKENQSFEN